MKKLPVLLLSAALSFGAAGDEPAHFEGRVLVEWLDDDPFVPALRLVDDFTFQQASGKLWTVPRGEVLDGKSLPPLFRDLVGPPFEGAFRKAAIVYDFATHTMHEPWRDAQRMFLEAALAEGVDPPDARAMYLVLHAQGSRWEVAGSRCYGTCHSRREPLVWRPVVDEAGLGELLRWVRTAEPAVDEIEARAKRVILDRGPHIFPRKPCFDASGPAAMRVEC